MNRQKDQNLEQKKCTLHITGKIFLHHTIIHLIQASAGRCQRQRLHLVFARYESLLASRCREVEI